LQHNPFLIWLLNILLQVTIPLGVYEKLPVSVSFITRQGHDLFLLDTVHTMYASLQEQVDIAMKSNISNSSISKEESAEIAKEKVSSSSYRKSNISWPFLYSSLPILFYFFIVQYIGTRRLAVCHGHAYKI